MTSNHPLNDSTLGSQSVDKLYIKLGTIVEKNKINYQRINVSKKERQ